MASPTADGALRLGQVVAGAATAGTGLALMIRARLGAQPWDVLHLAVSGLLHVSVGAVIIGVSVVVLAAWWPLRLRPGWGTLAMTFIPGLACDGVLALLPAPDSMIIRPVLLVAGLLLFAVGTAAVIRAQLGPGARDGLMVGLCARFGWSVAVVRAGIEVSVLVLGLLLLGPARAVAAGPAGVGTVVVALLLGPMLDVLLDPILLPRRPIDSRPPAG